MEESASSDIKTLEFNFNQTLGHEPFDYDALLALLDEAHTVKSYTAEKMANELQDRLIAKKDVDGLVKLLAKKAEWNGDATVFGQPVPQVLRQACCERPFLTRVEGAVFGQVRPSESFRRLAVLRSLAEGESFFHRTWGLGQVTRVDNFNSKVYLDFPSRPGHAMSFAYAAETLSAVAPDHILAVAHRDPGAIEDMIAKRPGDLIKAAVANFGPSSVTRLQKLLENYGIVPAADWKPFWARARKALASDPLVNIPARRSEPITLRETALRYDDDWFRALKDEKNIPRLFETLSVYERAKGKPEATPFAREVLTDRLTFAINGAFLYPPPMFTRLVLMAQRLNVTTPRDELVEILLDDERFLVAGDKLPVGEAGEMVRFIVDTRPEAVGLLLGHLPGMNYSLLKQTMATLREKPEFLEPLKDRARELLASPSAPAPLLVWTLRDNDWESLKDWRLPSLYELMEHAIAVCEDQAAAGEQLQMQHHIKDLYGKVDGWFSKAFGTLNALQQEALFMRLQSNASVADPRRQRDLVKAMTAINPALAAKKVSAAAKPAAPELHYTSWRSLRNRHEAFRHLVEVEIPKNTQDIEFARGFGDLRENFEYQAAKDQQRILLARREEWGAALEKVRGASFHDMGGDFSAVAMGTQVTLGKADGSTLVYSILGEWDNDETLGILSCMSRLAKILAGKKVGEKVSIPAVGGEEEVVVKAVSPLPPAVRDWIGQPISENA